VQNVRNLLLFRLYFTKLAVLFTVRTLTIAWQECKKWQGYPVRLWGYSVNLSLSCRITVIFHLYTAVCLRPHLTHHDITFRISGTRSSHPFAKIVLKSTSSHRNHVVCFYHRLHEGLERRPWPLDARWCFFLVMYFSLPSFPIFSPR
jgi:hypothetical protein